MFYALLIVLVIRLFIFPAYSEARNNNRIDPARAFISPLADQQPITKLTKILPSYASPLPSVTPFPDPSPVKKGNSILDQVNQYRAKYGLNKVIENAAACAFARLRLEEVAQQFNHDGFQNRIKSGTLPYPDYSRVTENLAKTNASENVVPMWSNSPAHAANMREDTPYVCIARSGEYYVYEGWKPVLSKNY